MQSTVPRDKTDPDALVKMRDRLEVELGSAIDLTRVAMSKRQRDLAERIDALDEQIEKLGRS
jgi:hypothetical protein